MNRRVVESFVKSGSFDSLDPRRSALFALDRPRRWRRARSSQRDREQGQSSLFGMLGGPDDAATAAPERIPDAPPGARASGSPSRRSRSGFFITGHPLERFREELAQWATATTGGSRSWPSGRGGDGGRASSPPSA